MGLFSSIKKNLNHGGVKIELSGPSSINFDDTFISAKIMITAGTDPVKIKSLKLQLKSRKAYTNDNQGSTALAKTDIPETFELAPGQKKEVDAKLNLDADKSDIRKMPEGAGKTAAMAVAELMAIGDNVSRLYYLQASADVEGIKLDPSIMQDIQINTN